MTPGIHDSQRWRVIEDLFQAAFDLPPAKRPEFLDRACCSDSSLRLEVEALLASADHTLGFIQQPVLDAARTVSQSFVSGGKRVGTHLGPYEILEPIGAGGMGQVYKARDTRLNRTVAIKVLPPEFASQPDWKQRFEREAQTIASLNHPHICTLHDVGQQDGIDYLVMEYLEGPTLAQRLERGALPLDEALKIAIEIGDALDKAHSQCIVHRDFKPANVMLTKSGVKLLDFGLAKPNSFAGQAGEAASPAAGPGLTAQGTILGTLQYMGPEQLEGEEADPRTDIFAFGAVLFEMVTGRKAFQGKSQVSVIAAILEREPPPVSSLQKLIPPTFDYVVQKSLAKNPDDRWQSMRDVVTLLDWSVRKEPKGAEELSILSGTSRRWWLLSVALTVIVISIAANLAMYWRIKPTDSRPMHFTLNPPPNVVPKSLAISPDGTRIVFASISGARSLWIKDLQSAEDAKELQGTAGAADPFWSPDGRYIAYFVQNKLNKIAATGGAAQMLAESTASGGPLEGGGAWNPDGDIIFSPGIGALVRMSEGGEGRPVTLLDKSRNDTTHRWPVFLPDGHHFLFVAEPENAICVGSVDSMQSSVLMKVQSPTRAVYAPPGFLLFLKERTLMAAPFDLQRLTVRGDSEAIVGENVIGLSSFSVSNTSFLIYTTANPFANQLQIVDRSGKQLASIGAKGAYSNPELSPDGRHVAIDRDDPSLGSNSNIWIMDVERGTPTRLTFDGGADAVWSPDGKDIAFFSSTAKQKGIYRTDATGAGQKDLIVTVPEATWPTSWSHDGRYLIYRTVAPNGKRDVWFVDLNGDRKPQLYLDSPLGISRANLSPNGKWLAYLSQNVRNGKPEIFVNSFPLPSSRIQISSGEQIANSYIGGAQVRWRNDGKEFFYVSGDEKLTAVDVSTSGGTFQPGVPHPLFGVNVDSTNRSSYDVFPDGQRFIINSVVTDPSSLGIHVVLNWQARLKK